MFWLPTRMGFLPRESQILTMTLKLFLTVTLVFLFTHWNTGRETLGFAWGSPAICINAAYQRHCIGGREGRVNCEGFSLLYLSWAHWRLSIKSLVEILNFILTDLGYLWAQAAFMCYKGSTSRRSNSNVLQNQGETWIMFSTISSELNASFLISSKRSF